MSDDTRSSSSGLHDTPEDIVDRSQGNQRPLATDCEQAIGFLQRFKPGGPWRLVAIPLDKKQGLAGRTFDANSLPHLRRWLSQHNETRNIYFHVNSVRADFRGHKAKKKDIEQVDFLHVDIDPASDKTLADEQARILRGLTQGLPVGMPKPTAIIFSGGGYQAFWKLAEPVPVRGDAAEAERAERYNRELERVLGGDNCHNIDRVMRLPGTVNLPTEEKRKKGRVAALARVIAFTESAHALSAFPQTDANSAKHAGARRDIAILDRFGVGNRVKEIISEGRIKAEPKQGDDSRSAWLYDVLCNLLRCKVPDGIIISIITDPHFAISESVLAHGAKAVDYARTQIEKAKKEVAVDDDAFEVNKSGIVANSQHNIRVALRKLGLRLSHDRFQDRLLVSGPDGKASLLDDKAIDRLWLLVDERFHFRPTREFFGTVVCDFARRAAFHPVRDYLKAVAWDEVKRLDTWLSCYGGAPDTPYTRAIGALVLIAAVRRVREPGCKFDEMLVLEGTQGTNKSNALRTLACHDDWFSDDVPLNADSKRVIESLSGRWIVEAAELTGMKKSDVEHLKAFLSRGVDRARLSYERLPTEVRRQCVIIGTTNSERYLRDGTGNRRFWPVRIAKFDVDALLRDRDQLWAEAAHREAKGESIRLDPTLYADAATQQEVRRVEDPFVDALAGVLADIRGKLHHEDAWTILDIPPGKRTQLDNSRLGEAMRELGFERTKARFGGKNPENCYVRGKRAERERRIYVVRDSMRRAKATHVEDAM